MSDTMVMKLIEMMQTLSPQLWGILMRQVQVELAVSVGWSVILGGLAAFLWRNKQKIADRVDDDIYWSWDGEVSPIFYIFEVMLVFLTLLILSWVVQTMVNPEYYALKLLLGQ